MGGQGFVPEDGKGALVEGSEEARERRKEHAYEQPGGAAPRAGMQGNVNRGAAPEQRLDRPGTTPPEGGRVDVERARRPGIDSGAHGLQDKENTGPLGRAGADGKRRNKK